jgi:hypothetical protein
MARLSTITAALLLASTMNLSAADIEKSDQEIMNQIGTGITKMYQENQGNVNFSSIETIMTEAFKDELSSTEISTLTSTIGNDLEMATSSEAMKIISDDIDTFMDEKYGTYDNNNSNNNSDNNQSPSNNNQSQTKLEERIMTMIYNFIDYDKLKIILEEELELNGANIYDLTSAVDKVIVDMNNNGKNFDKLGEELEIVLNKYNIKYNFNTKDTSNNNTNNSDESTKKTDDNVKKTLNNDTTNDDSTNKSNTGENTDTTNYAQTKGWNLLGAVNTIDPSNMECVSTVWAFENGNWSLYQNISNTTNFGYSKLNQVKQGMGYWIDSTCNTNPKNNNIDNTSTSELKDKLLGKLISFEGDTAGSEIEIFLQDNNYADMITSDYSQESLNDAKWTIDNENNIYIEYKKGKSLSQDDGEVKTIKISPAHITDTNIIAKVKDLSMSGSMNDNTYTDIKIKSIINKENLDNKPSTLDVSNKVYNFNNGTAMSDDKYIFTDTKAYIKTSMGDLIEADYSYSDDGKTVTITYKDNTDQDQEITLTKTFAHHLDLLSIKDNMQEKNKLADVDTLDLDPITLNGEYLTNTVIKVNQNSMEKIYVLKDNGTLIVKDSVSSTNSTVGTWALTNNTLKFIFDEQTYTYEINSISKKYITFKGMDANSTDKDKLYLASIKKIEDAPTTLINKSIKNKDNMMGGADFNEAIILDNHKGYIKNMYGKLIDATWSQDGDTISFEYQDDMSDTKKSMSIEVHSNNSIEVTDSDNMTAIKYIDINDI